MQPATLTVLDRNGEALASYNRAIALDPDFVEAHNNRGNTLRALRRPAEALASFERALAIRPDYVEAFCNRGNALIALGRIDEALASFDRALALKPTYADALINRAAGLRLLGREAEAAVSYRQALAVNPDHIETLIGLGNCMQSLQHYDEALACSDRVLTLRPDMPEIFSNRGNALWCLRRPAEALASYEAALALKPDYADAHNNRGLVLLELNRPDEALPSFDRALALKPGYTDALINRGNAMRDLKRAGEAIECYDAALAINPDLADGHWNKALEQLLTGQFEQGFANYEWRWKRAGTVARDFAQPQWRGEDLTGKIILLHAEQGFGDIIQFVRYAPMVAARGATVILEGPDALLQLLSGIEGVTALVSRGAPLPPFDLHCPLMSLPLAFGTTLATVPAALPYLRVPPASSEKWQGRLPRSGLPRVGLVWSGTATHKNDHNRSFPLERLAPLLAKPGMQFVSLQRELRDADAPALAAFPALLRLETDLADFADTAAVIAELDLVIAVDTAVAHLAGALGKPVWILLAHVQDWRWLLDREDSPWYPSARLFRQPQIGDWDSVIGRLAGELDRELASAAKNGHAAA
jgi:tetratricopeptide (TPR) repeat protein